VAGGRFTTGDAELDQLIKQHCDNWTSDDLSQADNAFNAYCNEVYAKDSGSSFHGDGLRYHVYTYQDGAYIEKMLKWSDTEGETLWSGSYSEAADAWLAELEASSEFYPDYASCVYSYRVQEDNSELIAIWDETAGMLYMLESFL